MRRREEDCWTKMKEEISGGTRIIFDAKTNFRPQDASRSRDAKSREDLKAVTRDSEDLVAALSSCLALNQFSSHLINFQIETPQKKESWIVG